MNHKSHKSFENVVIKPLSTYQISSVISAFSAMKFGIFVWDYDANTCYVNEYMVERFSINMDEIESLNEFLSLKIEDKSLFAFFDRIYKMRVETKTKELELPVKSKNSVNWFKLHLSYDNVNDVAIGIVTNLKIDEQTQIENEAISNIFKSTLTQIGFPLCLFDKNGIIKFTNFDVLQAHREIYSLIETVHREGKTKSTDLYEVKLVEKNIRESHHTVKQFLNDKDIEESIVRSIVYYDKEEYIMYRHQRLLDSTTEQQRLRKILRANELMMEIKDIVDHIDDLNEMFSYLLSKIQTVIPEANQSCILRLDKNNLLYLDESYGFNEEYIEEFKLPFKKSFAYMHLQNDYSKSVIINDIQQKYSNLFPDISIDEKRIAIESNITAPLVIDNHLYGLISVDSNQNRVFDDVDLNLLDFMKTQVERAIVQFRKYKSIKRDSTEDSLTGVSNRRHLQDILKVFQERSVLENRTFHFVLFDIDKLKKINDTYGHNAGDIVIKEFAEVIKNSIRDTDFLSRIGGDEFVGLFYNISEEVLQQRISDWQLFFTNNPIEYKGNMFTIDFSYGVSTFPDEGLYFSELMEKSDTKMYLEKELKRDGTIK